MSAREHSERELQSQYRVAVPCLLLVGVALSVACSLNSDFRGTKFRCGERDRCPTGYACVAEVCRAPGDTGPDAAELADAKPALAKWTQATSLPIGSDYNHQHAALVGDTVYMIGGYDVTQSAESAVVYRASSENTGAWTTTTSLPAPRALGDVVTSGARIYVVGGADGGVAQTTVYVGEPDVAGNISSWSSASALPAPRKAHTAAAANGYIYVVGGADSSNARVMSVFFAPVGAGGSLGSWQVATTLPAPRANLSGVAARGFLYAIGGDSGDATNHETVYVAALDPNNGQVGPWTTTTPLPAARKSFVAVSDGSHIYVIGGLGAFATGEVLFSQIGDDGTLGPWEINEPLLMPRYRHAGVLANGQLFVLGGAQAATSVERSSQGN